MKSSVWSPLKFPYFRAFWICAFISNLGTWIQDVSSSWVMTNLSNSPLVIALLSFSGSLPLMLLSIPAGYFSDCGDRRKILLWAQFLMFSAALILGINVWRGTLSEVLLLSLSCLMGVGAALNGPAFQTVLSDLVSPEEQQNAILVFYIGINATRVLGPAIGGGILSTMGPQAAYWINAVSFLGLILFFWKWPLGRKESPNPENESATNKKKVLQITEQDWKILFSIHNIKLWIEILCVTSCASCLWALYPTKGRVELHLSSLQYGSLLGFLGLGACVSALMSDRMMGLGKTAHSLALSYLLYSIGLLAVGFGDHYFWMCAGMFLAGMGWIILATLMNMSSRQLTGKSHLKATMLGVFLAVFYTGMAFGSVFWGALAHIEGLSFAFGMAALTLALVGLYKTNEARKLPRLLTKAAR